MPVWLTAMTGAEGGGTLTFAGGKEQAMEDKRSRRDRKDIKVCIEGPVTWSIQKWASGRKALT
jgi:hypothetical protein